MRTVKTPGKGAPRERMAPCRKSQRGVVISLIVTSAMVMLMANTLGTGTRTIEMTRLQQEIRAAMQMMTRDVRRANYNAEAILCFGNYDCGTDGTFVNGLPGDITISAGNDCFTFQLDRDHDGDSTTDDAGGFRRSTTGGGIGIIQMWTGGSAPVCTSISLDWVAVTDSEIVDITAFTVNDNASYTTVITDDGLGNQTLQKVRKIRLQLAASLIENSDVTREIEDMIRIRNDLSL